MEARMSVEVGQPAPAFELDASTGEKVSLSDYQGQGPTVLLFVPLAFTPVCTNELSVMRDDYETYTKLGARVLAASVDSQFTLKVWANQLKLPFPLLSDFNKETATAYGAIYDDLMGLRGVAKRAAFVIDRNGIIRYRWVSEDANNLPDFGELKAAVEQAAAT
jgi:peroxiredoxin